MKMKTQQYKYNSVLLIDDNDLDNFINEKMIESNNFSKSIHVSTDGQKALDFINKLINSAETGLENYPDVMFVDLNMPVMNGYQFIENFKKINNPLLMQCKIVVLTSSINHQDKLYAEKLDPAIIFVNKPLTNDFLSSL